jgi:anaerobic selenocysteine-containing dehydrogenase
MKFNRRRFLGFTAGAAAGTALGVPASQTLSDFVATAEEPIYPPRGPEDAVLSICRMCPGGCGVRVRRVGGRAVKADGNPMHPVNGGRLCPKGQAALQSLYHPDRIVAPLRRVGPRGSLDSFEAISWDEALGSIAERLQLLRQVGRPQSLAVLRGRERGIGARTAQRFLRAFGSPNDVCLERGEEAAALAAFLGQGVRTAPAYDLSSTDYVLSFGGALLEAWSSPVYTMSAFGEFRQGRPGRRGKLVQAESRLSITGSSADEWIAVQPGTEGILALGVARALVAEELYDRDFVSSRTAGLDAADGNTEGLGEFLDRSFSLERVAAATGVPLNTILRIAREFADARSQLAVGPRKGPLLPGTLFDHLAVQILNALVGNLDAPGGTLLPEEIPLVGLPDLPSDPVAERGLRHARLDRAGTEASPHLRSDPEALCDGLLEGASYPIEVLMLLDADPAFASLAPARFALALEKVPLVVSLASLPDDTTLLADLIVPQSHFFECWDLDTTPPGVPFPIVSLARPVADEPLHDTRPAVEIFLTLAHLVGDQVAAAFPWQKASEMIRAEVEGLYASKRGTIMGTRFDEAWVRMMERAGWWAPGYASPAELWQQMQERGGWWDPFYDHGDWHRVLRTESGRYEFQVDLLRELARARLDQPYVMAAPAADSEADVESAESVHLLALVLFEPLPVSAGIGAEIPFLQELLDPQLEERWETWAEIHPQTAESLGIADGQGVRITSDQGSITARARSTRRVVRGTVAMPLGLGKKGGGRWAAGRGSNPLRLLMPPREPFSGLPETVATRVRVEPLRRGEKLRS